MSDKLTQRQENFCRNFFETGNATEAAIAAGYSPKTARFSASRLLTKVNISEKLFELNEFADDESVGHVLERKQILTQIMRGKFADFMFNLTPEKLRNSALQTLKVTEVTIGGEGKDELKKKTTTIKLRDPIEAIAELNKMDHVYDIVAPTTIDNRALNIFVTSNRAKKLLKEIEEGIPPHESGDDEDI